MSWAQRLTNKTTSVQSDLRVDFTRNMQDTTVDGDSFSDVTALLSRYLGYDLGERDREKLELLETSAFSAPLVDSSSRVSLRLKDVDRTVCRLLEKYYEHARTTEGQGGLSLELSNIASGETVKEGLPRPDLQTKQRSERDPMNSSEYLKKCLTCDKTFTTVKQLVAHFMEKPQNELRIESHDGFQLSVNRDDTTELNEPLVTDSAIEPCTGAEPRDNPSSRRLECVDEAIPLTDHTVEYQQDRKQQSAVNTKRLSTNAAMPQSPSHMLKTKRPRVSGQRQHLKGRTVKSSSSDKRCNNVRNKNKTREVSSDRLHRDDKTNNNIQCTETRNNQAIIAFVPQNSSAIHTSGVTSIASSAQSVAAISKDVNRVSSGGRQSNSVHNTTQNSSQMEVPRSANSIAAPVVGPNPLEIMKKLTGLLALYQTKVQRRKDHTSSLTLSIPVRSPVTILPPPKSIPIGTVGCKRKYSSLETSAGKTADVGCESQCVSDTSSVKKKTSVCCSVTSTKQGTTLRQSCSNGGITMNNDSRHMAPTNQFNTSNNEELNVNVPSQSTLFGAHMIHQPKPINTQETVRTPIKPLYPLASSGKWLIYHLPAAVTSNFNASQIQPQNTSQKPRSNSFTGKPADCPGTTSTALIFPQGTTPTILRQSLQYPVMSTTLPLVQSHKTGKKVPAQAHQRPVATLTRACPSNAGIPTPKLAKTYGLASVISKRPTQRLGIQRSAGSLQPLRAQTTSKNYPKLLRPAQTAVSTSGSQVGKHVKFPNSTSGLLQPSIILQPIRAPPTTGRSLLHVPLLEVPDQQPRATSSPSNSGSPGAAESLLVPRSSSQVSSQSNNTTSVQTPLDGSNTATMRYSSAQVPSTVSQELSMSAKFPAHAQCLTNTKVPTLILKPKENVGLVSKETKLSCSPENQKIPGSVALFGHAQAAQRFRGVDKNSPTMREKKRAARAQLACRGKKPKTDSNA